MVISINDFLKKLIKTPELPGVFLVSILVPNKASLFYEQLLLFCRKYIKNISLIDEIEIEQTIPRLLSTSFLGERYFYWNFSQDLPNGVTNFLTNYRGPNCLFKIISSLNREPLPGELIVNIPSFVDRKFYNILYGYFYPRNTNNRLNLFEQFLFEHSSKYNLDQAFLLMRYQTLLQNEPAETQKQFFKLWYSLNIENYNFMFNLSDLLFSLDYNQFFLKWYEYKNLNPIEYWISFWSNQIFNAACFVKLATEHNADQARKSITGLPFSFINRHWKKYSFKKLLNAYSALYELDNLTKLNVSNIDSLELWYNRFLLNRP